MPVVEEICQKQGVYRAATILAIGTSNPPHCVYQDNYPDFYFGLTNSNHMTELRDTFKRMCEKSTIKKRYMHLTEEMLKENPNLCDHMAPSFNIRQDILVQEVPKLGKKAAEKAIKEWGQPKSKITHLIMCTSSGVDMPGADYEMSKLLDLDPSVCRVMLYYQGCYAGATVLRLAKDIAENNRNARVLVVCSEITTVKAFTKPSSKQMGNLVGQAVFGDGAAALIIGADPDVSIERPIFLIVSSAQTIVPQSEGAIQSRLRETGTNIHLQKNVPSLIGSNICNALNKAFTPLGISNWNSIFWILHPGGVAILDQIKATLGLREDKLAATHNVLREFGNMSSASVLFILDEMRKKSMEQGKETTGEGLDWGVLFGFGPGITIETIVLHSVPLNG